MISDQRIEEIFSRSMGWGQKREGGWESPLALRQDIDPKIKRSKALDIIDNALVKAANTPGSRTMVCVSPQEGKSQLVSLSFPLWLLTRDPDSRIAIVSYSDEMARRWGADIKLFAQMFNGDEGTTDLGLKLRKDMQAAGRWQIEDHMGGVYCCGTRGSLSGKPVNCLIIDDPIRNMEDANSPAHRDAAWRFWQAVAIPRLAPDSIVFLVQTRWHEDDLAGRIIESEGSDWNVISIPAICESPDDPLGRSVGEPMESVRGYRDWWKIKEQIGEHTFAALYQQRPAPISGGLFKKADFRYWSDLPVVSPLYGIMGGRAFDLDGNTVMLDDCWRFLTVDLAASTKNSADWTVAAVWGISLDGHLLLLDLVRDRIPEGDHWKTVRPLVSKWRADVVFVESRMFGTTFVIDATRSGIPIQELKADTDKYTRALPAATRINTHRAWFPAQAPWLDEFERELLYFPNGKWDDCTDVFAYAARIVAAHWVPKNTTITRPGKLFSPEEVSIENAFRSAVGSQNSVGYDIPRGEPKDWQW